MLNKELLIRLFDAASIQRWNDHIRPMEFPELDKQAHKMIIAYLVGMFEKEKLDFDWLEIIEGGIFDLLQRIVITDLKPQLFHRIKYDADKYKLLNKWIYMQIKESLDSLGEAFSKRYMNYFVYGTDNINRKILASSHFFSTKWEFAIIEKYNHEGFEISHIRDELKQKQEKYYDLEGIRQITLYSGLKNFVDLCGQLRFQQRWSHMYRVPKTSVLGHMLLVAIISYFISIKIGACKRRARNNFFCGLFHDLPEAMTKDILSPIKSSVEGLMDIIKDYENREISEKVFKMIPLSWHSEMEAFTKYEFDSMINATSNKVKTDTNKISKKYNTDKYDPMDGEIVRFADHLTAFIEAYLALENGIKNKEFKKAALSLVKTYRKTKIAGLDFGSIYEQFDF